jgi:hypothetical protein
LAAGCSNRASGPMLPIDLRQSEPSADNNPIACSSQPTERRPKRIPSAEPKPRTEPSAEDADPNHLRTTIFRLFFSLSPRQSFAWHVSLGRQEGPRLIHDDREKTSTTICRSVSNRRPACSMR